MVYMWLSGTLSVGSVFTPTFLTVSRHSPEHCPMNNERMAKLTMELPGKLVDAALKHNNSGEINDG
jgi:hypothetical protein